MREFQFIEEVMPAVPPASPEQIAAVRARVMSAASNSGGALRSRTLPSRVLRSRRAGRVRRPVGAQRITHGLIGTVLAAVAVVLVITVVMVAMPRPSEQAAVTSPRQVLDAAADRLAAQQPATGRYWWLKTQVLMRTKDAEVSMVEIRGDDVLVIGRDGHRYTWYETVSTRPYGSAATRAWKRAGSHKLCPGRGCDSNNRFYASRSLDQALKLANGHDLTLKDLLDLPKEATALRTRLLAGYSPNSDLSREQWLMEVGIKLVTETPATPGTRAAGYRMLAALPGVSVTERVTDVIGRQGVVLQLPTPQGVVQTQLVIDKESGEPLAVQGVGPMPGLPEGTAVDVRIIKMAGWTDTRPVVPPGCRPGCEGTY
ncbi:CU044_5270 family protein [Nonomuraea guangzhouensis]|uniref:CU044_5270 family protein n=1 Tax=Nonomuraea guangzhouensis TaxID=1291555 RepID=A0ABW4GPH6_9ACTN|nr:CU044_5270 family protein [Nonomuraea guangzhouensis]